MGTIIILITESRGYVSNEELKHKTYQKVLKLFIIHLISFIYIKRDHLENQVPRCSCHMWTNLVAVCTLLKCVSDLAFVEKILCFWGIFLIIFAVLFSPKNAAVRCLLWVNREQSTTNIAFFRCFFSPFFFASMVFCFFSF